MDHLEKLEAQSVYILREAYKHFDSLCMLWSIGKDSTVLLWLARKAFFGHVPFPLVHIDTSYKLPEMIQYRDRLALEYGLYMVVGQDEATLAAKDTFPDKLAAAAAAGTPLTLQEQAQARVDCCGKLKAGALKATLAGTGKRRRLNLQSGTYEDDPNTTPFTGVIVGARADEEGSRSKERYFSPRDKNNQWDVGDQPPEFWNQFKTDFAPGTHVRVHPLLDWTELNIWEYIQREAIPTVSLYYDQGDGTRYRSLGCGPCQKPIHSTSKNVADIIAELTSGSLRDVAERSGRMQDGKHGLEELRRQGYM
ncbi:sulfate adenylyltransferase [Planctomycetota bacterium]|nr:sulfate adenylyltransferase [Planctomycetota bacterium]